MESVLNSDINVRGFAYHIQTQDFGEDFGFVKTQIFRDGAVVKVVKNEYDSIFKTGPRSQDQAIRLAMKKQHQEILDLLLSGHLL